MDKRADHNTLKRLLGPAEPELLCDECFEKIDEYVELELRGAKADELIPGMRPHLEGCPPATRNTTACSTSCKTANPTAAVARPPNKPKYRRLPGAPLWRGQPLRGPVASRPRAAASSANLVRRRGRLGRAGPRGRQASAVAALAPS
jgi:hypothetical protein